MEKYKDNTYTKKLIEGQYCLYSDTYNTSSPITFIIIPGNPSIAELYIQFGNLLAKQFKYPVIISSLLSNDTKTYSLEKVIEYKKKFFEYLFKNNPNTKYIVLGHSIGNYIIFQALRKIKDINNIIAIYSLFPALQNLYSCFPFDYKLLTFNYLIINIFAIFIKILKYLPLCIIILFFKFVSDVPSDKVECLINNIGFSSIRQILFLAKDEGKYIKEYSQDLIDFLNKISHKLRMIYGKNDRYGNEKIAKKFKELVPNATIKIVDILHAFVLGYTHDIFNEIVDMIDEDINNCEK